MKLLYKIIKDTHIHSRVELKNWRFKFNWLIVKVAFKPVQNDNMWNSKHQEIQYRKENENWKLWTNKGIVRNRTFEKYVVDKHS